MSQLLDSSSLSAERRQAILQEARRALAHTRERDRVLTQLHHQATVTRDRFLNDLPIWDHLCQDLTSIVEVDRQLRSLTHNQQRLFETEWRRIVAQEETGHTAEPLHVKSLREQIDELDRRRADALQRQAAHEAFLATVEQSKAALHDRIHQEEKDCESLRSAIRRAENEQQQIKLLEAEIEQEKQMWEEERLAFDEDEDIKTQLEFLKQRNDEAAKELHRVEAELQHIQDEKRQLEDEQNDYKQSQTNVDWKKLQREVEAESGMPALEQQLCNIEIQLAEKEDLRIALSELAVEKQRLASTETILQSVLDQVQQHRQTSRKCRILEDICLTASTHASLKMELASAQETLKHLPSISYLQEQYIPNLQKQVLNLSEEHSRLVSDLNAVNDPTIDVQIDRVQDAVNTYERELLPEKRQAHQRLAEQLFYAKREVERWENEEEPRHAQYVAQLRSEQQRKQSSVKALLDQVSALQSWVQAQAVEDERRKALLAQWEKEDAEETFGPSGVDAIDDAMSNSSIVEIVDVAHGVVSRLAVPHPISTSTTAVAVHPGVPNHDGSNDAVRGVVGSVLPRIGKRRTLYLALSSFVQEFVEIVRGGAHVKSTAHHPSWASDHRVINV